VFGIGVFAVLAAWKAEPGAISRTAWIGAASAILGWQLLLSAFTELPDRSAYKMLLTVRPLIQPETELFSVGQYRETISPYLGRTMTLVDFEGELAFGLREEPSKALTPEAFLAHWNASTNAVVFMNPSLYDTWRKRGLQGKVIGADGTTLAVSRL
jgi:hypothetical protein